MQHYAFTLLPGFGWANGINDKGLVVGTCSNEACGSPSAAWWVPSGKDGTYDISTPDPESESLLGLVAINNVGLVIPGNELICITAGNANSSLLPSAVIGSARALNNVGQLVSGNTIYFWPVGSGNPTEMPSLDGKVLGLGINDLGDVVGTWSNGARAFFYPRQPIGANPIFSAGLGALNDINTDRLAVGNSTDQNGFQSPAYLQCPTTTGGPTDLPMVPLPTVYPLPKEFGTNTAYAINHTGTIIGTARGTHLPQKSNYAFVVPPPYDMAYDLNNSVVDSQGWHLETATGINEQGQIVGQATRGNDSAGFVATPITYVSWEIIGNLLGNLITYAGSLLSAGNSGRMGIGLPPGGWGSLTGASVPPEQRETLLSFAISNVAGSLNDDQARSRIQGIASQAASLALGQRKTRERPAPTAAQLEQIARMRSRISH